MSEIVSVFIGIVSTLIGIIIIYFVKHRIDMRQIEFEEKEIKDEYNSLKDIVNNGEVDVLNLMAKNSSVVNEYYVITKQQARNAYSASLLITILGFLLFAAGEILSYIYNTVDIILYSTISGVIIEVIAVLFFLQYLKAIKQINLFNSSLLKSQKFLTAIQLVEKISPPHRDTTYAFIVREIISQGKDEELFKDSKQDK